jgi:hypothetical protein
MDPSFDQYKSNHSSCCSIATTETYDITNNTSTSSGVSLDMDVHGLAETSRHCNRSSHPNNRTVGDFEKERHVRDVSSGDSFNNFGESFMMEDSFAYGESFSTSCYNDNARYNNKDFNIDRYKHQQQDALSKLSVDISSILFIEEECEDACLQEMEREKEVTTELLTSNSIFSSNYVDLSHQNMRG